jgi:RNA polymerase sigma-70 factor (ECF subfamily)
MVAFRLDQRIAARIDASDVVQETLAEADQKLPAYLQRRPLPFYPWLRQLALERMARLYRQHVQARKRTVLREERALPRMPDASAAHLAAKLWRSGSSAGSRLRREELQMRLQAAMADLPEADRELLLLRHVEQMPLREMASVLRLSDSAVKMRHLRALARLRSLLGADLAEET